MVDLCGAKQQSAAFRDPPTNRFQIALVKARRSRRKQADRWSGDKPKTFLDQSHLAARGPANGFPVSSDKSLTNDYQGAIPADEPIR